MSSVTVRIDPLEFDVESEHVGCARVRFIMAMRHFCTEVPFNERISHRITMDWLVTCRRSGQILGVISQTDHSHQHPEIILTLPENREILLTPNSPYIVMADSVIGAEVFPLNAKSANYRYEVEVGASSDDSIIGDGWSYREGRLPFMHWFHNKAFRWAFDGAELFLPCSPEASLWVDINALARTPVSVYANGQLVFDFSITSDGTRWHNQHYGFMIPAALVDAETVKLTFRMSDANRGCLDFNLRQTLFAVSRLVVDVMDGPDSRLPPRIVQALWGGPSDRPHCLAGVVDADASFQAQCALVVADLEFDLLNRCFAPHSSFWNTLRGLAEAFEGNGVSLKVVRRSDAAAQAGACTRVVGPIRFPGSQALSPRDLVEIGADGALLDASLAALSLAGLSIDDGLLGLLCYRELYDVAFGAGEVGSFWEFIFPKALWASEILGWDGNVLIGRTSEHGPIWLASASAEDWIETGDPAGRFVLDRFVASVGPARFASAGDLACRFFVSEGRLRMAVRDDRVAFRSYGGGIARGWPAMSSDLPMVAKAQEHVAFDAARMPASGLIAEQLRRLVGKVAGMPVELCGEEVVVDLIP